MISIRTARETLDRCYLDIRSRILDIAASLDRIECGMDADTIRDDEKLRRVGQALMLLTDGESDRTERVQRLFSLAYDPRWQA